MLYYTNYDLIYKDKPDLEMRDQTCYTNLSQNILIDCIGFRIYIPNHLSEACTYPKESTREEIEEYINILIKCGFPLTLEDELFEISKGCTGYRVFIPIDDDTRYKYVLMFYGAYVRYIYEKTNFAVIEAVKKLINNISDSDSMKLMCIAEQSIQSLANGAGHGSVSMKVSINLYNVFTFKERVNEILRINKLLQNWNDNLKYQTMVDYPTECSMPIHNSFLVNGVIDSKKNQTMGYNLLTQLINDNNFNEIIEIFNLKPKQIAIKKKNLRSRSIVRI